jgi:hypothetical protein
VGLLAGVLRVLPSSLWLGLGAASAALAAFAWRPLGAGRAMGTNTGQAVARGTNTCPSAATGTNTGPSAATVTNTGPAAATAAAAGNVPLPPAQVQGGGLLPQEWRVVICYGAFGFGYIVPATFLPAMARELVPDPAAFGWAWPLFGAVAALSTVLTATLSRPGAQRAQWQVAQAVMALGVLAPVLVPGLPMLLLGAVCVGGSFMVITMVGMMEARRLSPARAPRLMAAMTAAFAAGQLLGPLVVVLAARVSNQATGLASALAAAALLFSSAALWAHRPPGDSA